MKATTPTPAILEYDHCIFWSEYTIIVVIINFTAHCIYFSMFLSIYIYFTPKITHLNQLN